jgi:hypothetical protein
MFLSNSKVVAKDVGPRGGTSQEVEEVLQMPAPSNPDVVNLDRVVKRGYLKVKTCQSSS